MKGFSGIMENAELKLILENSFTPAQLKSLLQPAGSVGNVYEAAAHAILNGEVGGDAISQELDSLSERQRGKISSMTISQIRESISPEFIEPGKTLSSILWALLRDDRIGVRNLARTIGDAYSADDSVTSEPMDDDLAQADELTGIDFDMDDQEDISIPGDDNNDGEDIDVDDLLEQLSRESERNVLEDSDEEEPDFSDLDVLLDAGDDEGDRELLEIPDESEIDYDDLKIDPLQTVDTSEQETNNYDETDTSIFGHPISEEEFKEVENLLDLKHDETGEPYLEFDSEEDTEIGDMVSLGGVYISLHSLQRACEKVFEEPVELVADENLTSDDKIVVVGKNCGVKVLYGPHYSIQQPESPKVDEGDPVNVSPVSMQAALSRIFDEHVELIPDPTLLDHGVVPFAGKHTGIEVLQNDKIKIALPPWVDSKLANEINQDEPVVSDDLATQLSSLEQRLAALEERGVSSPPVPEPEPAPEPEPEQKPEPEAEVEVEGDVADEALSMDDIETEELEPVHEDFAESDDEEESGPLDELVLSDLGDEELTEDDDLDALISGDELDEIAGELDEVSDGDGDDLDLSDLDLDSISDDLGELGDLDLDGDSDDDVEVNEDDDIGAAEIDLGDEEIDLGDEDIDLGEDADINEEDIDIGEDEINLDDLDLDLEGLDLDDEDTFEPKEVLNGETVLLLGGDPKYKDDYSRIITEIGGKSEWYEKLDEAGEDEVNELVERADVIMTLTADAVSDPGILQATNMAQENNKRLFNHHSATPSSVQKQLVKLVEDGQV